MNIKIFKYLKNYKLTLVGLLLATLLTTIFGTMYPYLTAIIIDEILVQRSLQKLIYIMSIIFAVFCLHQLCRVINLALLRRLYTKFVLEIKIQIFNNVLNMEYEKVSKQKTGDIIQRIEHDSFMWVEYLYVNVAYGLSDWMEFILQLVFLALLNKKLFLLTCLCMPIYTFASKYYEKKLKIKEQQFINILSSLNSFIVEVVYNISEIRIIGALPFLRKSIEENYKNIKEAKINIRKVQFKSSRINKGISAVMQIIYFIISYILIRNDRMTLGVFIASYSYFKASLLIFYDLNEKSNNKEKYFSCINRTIEFIDYPTAYRNKEESIDRTSTNYNTIEIKGMSFYYNDNVVLKDINALIVKGKINYIVGKSGSGKSTLINLLSGLYVPESGEINIDGIPITKCKDVISVMHQQSILFKESLAFNLTFGSNIPEEKIWKVLEIVNLVDRVKSLPNQLNTKLSDGIDFSGGEKQRVIIARMLLANKKIMIFDEPVSALDSLNRLSIIKHFETIAKDKIIIIVTHNIEVISEKSVIYKLHNNNLFKVEEV